MAYVEGRDGVPLYYESHGAGPCLVLIHAWGMGTAYWWQHNLEALAQGNRVVVLDLRGNGASGKTDEGHTLGQYARDVRFLVRELELEPVSLLGWSMGAMVVLEYVSQFGSAGLTSIAIVDQSPRDLPAPDWSFPFGSGLTPENVAGLILDLRTARARRTREIIRGMFLTPPPENVVSEMYAAAAQTPNQIAATTMLELINADLRAVVPTIDVPTLLLYGSHSQVFPGAIGEWMHAQIPGSELIMFENSGHCPFWEEPDTFNKAVVSFLARQSPQ